MITGRPFLNDRIMYTILHYYSNNHDVICKFTKGVNSGELRSFEDKEVHNHVIDFTRSLFMTGEIENLERSRILISIFQHFSEMTQIWAG